MENNVHASYLIPVSRFEKMEKAVKKLARKVLNGKTAAEFPPEIEATHEVLMVWNGGIMRPFNAVKNYPTDAEFIPYLWVTLKYSRPVLNGWHLVAVYDWEITDDGKRTCYVSPVPGQMVLPELRDVEDGRCDHCQTNRRRNKSMLVTKDFMDFKVVGSTCVKDFLGHATPNSFIDCYKFEQTIERLSDGSYAGGGATGAYHTVKGVLELSAMFIRLSGYVKAGDWDKRPTVEEIKSYMFGTSSTDVAFRLANAPNESDINVAELTAKWIAEQSGASDYIENLQKAVKAGAISPKRFAIVASSVFVYQKSREDAEKAGAPVCNEWLGEVKERLKGLVADVERVRYSDGYYGTTTIITLRTPQGHTLVWFATGNKEVERNDTWTFDGTVKKHDEYNGTKQTVINRVTYQVA